MSKVFHIFTTFQSLDKKNLSSLEDLGKVHFIENNNREKIIVANNNHYGTIRYHQEVHFPGRNHYATNLVNPNFKEYGESFGIKSFIIETIDEIPTVLKKAISIDRPALIEFKMSLELNTSSSTLSELQLKKNN